MTSEPNDGARHKRQATKYEWLGRMALLAGGLLGWAWVGASALGFDLATPRKSTIALMVSDSLINSRARALSDSVKVLYINQEISAGQIALVLQIVCAPLHDRSLITQCNGFGARR